MFAMNSFLDIEQTAVLVSDVAGHQNNIVLQEHQEAFATDGMTLSLALRATLRMGKVSRWICLH